MAPPTKEAFAEIVGEIRTQRKSHSEATAAAVELLAFTGRRISEAQQMLWGDVDAIKGHYYYRGAKNKAASSAPLIPAAKALLDRLEKAGIPHGPKDPVMLVKSLRIALANACERMRVDHIRVHDLRHIFATRCLESGVDFPTLANWLGHQDGGILAAKTYGHLVPDHSSAQSDKVQA